MNDDERHQRRVALMNDGAERQRHWAKARAALECSAGPLMLDRTEADDLDDAGLTYAARDRRAAATLTPDRGRLPFAEAAEQAERQRLEHAARLRRAERARSARQAVEDGRAAVIGSRTGRL